MTHGRKAYVVPGARSLARSVGICITVPRHLGACRGLEDLVDIGVAKLTISHRWNVESLGG